MENDIPAVICNGCSAEMPGFKPLTAEQTVAQWNRRDERDALAALLGRVQEFVRKVPDAAPSESARNSWRNVLLANIDAALKPRK